MLKLIIIFILIVSNSQAYTFTVIDITSNSAFNYFSSLFIWLFIIQAPLILAISLFKFIKKTLL